jgi:hypothetical protein
MRFKPDQKIVCVKAMQYPDHGIVLKKDIIYTVHGYTPKFGVILKELLDNPANARKGFREELFAPVDDTFTDSVIEMIKEYAEEIEEALLV